VTTTHRFRRNLWLPAGWYSSLVGWGARRPLPRALRRPVYATFSRLVGADLGEVEHDLADYPSFGDFFARKLRAGARSFALPDEVLAAPCDGTLAIAGGIPAPGTLIQAKGRDYRLAELVADEELARRLSGGWYATIYLSPADYHRVHAPLDGAVVAVDYLPGTLWPVKPFFTRTVEGLLARNERLVIQLDTSYGPVAVVMIAAVGVGHLCLRDGDGALRAVATRRRERRRIEPGPPLEVRRGDELGAFLLGSTVVLVLPPGAVAPEPPAEGAPVRCGQPIGRLLGPGSGGARR
jgi:phosphatidylserine decarboxylase